MKTLHETPLEQIEREEDLGFDKKVVPGVWIQSVQISNFKTYKNSTRIKFDRGITCLCGRNFSGKSNIIDALKFVLGCSSPSELRLRTGLEEVRHKSSSGNVSRTKVVIDVNAGEKGRKKFTRFFTNRSKWLVDGKEMTKREYMEELAQLSLSYRGHNFVSQGEIGEKPLNDPEWRQTEIEKALGTASLKEETERQKDRLQEIQQDLKNSKRMILHYKDRLRTLEPYVEEAKQKAALKGQLLNFSMQKKFLRLQELENQLKDFKTRLITLRGNKHECSETHSEVSSSLNLISKSREKIREEQLQIEFNLEKAKSKKSLIIERSRKIFEEISLLKKKISQTEEEFEERKTTKDEKEAQLVSERKKKEKILKKINSTVKNIEEESKEEEELSSRLKALGEVLNQQKLDLLKKEKENLEKNLFETERKILQKNSTLGGIEQDQKKIKKEITKKSEELSLHEEKINQFEEETIKLSDIRSELRVIVDTLKQSRIWEENSRKEVNPKYREVFLAVSNLKGLLKNIEGLLDHIEEFSSKSQTIETHQELGSKRTRLQKEIVDLSDKIEHIHKTRINLQAKIKDSENLLQELNARRNEVAQKIASIEKSLDIRTIASELQIAKRKVDSFQKRLKDFRKSEYESEKSIGNLRIEVEEQASALRFLKEKQEGLGRDLVFREKESNSQSGDLKIVQLDLDKHQALQKEFQRKSENLQEKMEGLNFQERELRSELLKLEKEIGDLSLREEEYVHKIDRLNLELSGHERDSSLSNEEIEKTISILEGKLRTLKNVDETALEKFELLSREYNHQKKRKKHLDKEHAEIKEIIRNLEDKRKVRLVTGLQRFNGIFQGLLAEIFDDGRTYRVFFPEDDIKRGLNFKGRVKEREIFNLEGTSGGERTIIAVCFLLALQRMSPSPFYVLDEFNAFLDRKNTSRISSFFRSLAGERNGHQHVIVTPDNENVLIAADTIYMVEFRDEMSFVFHMKTAKS